MLQVCGGDQGAYLPCRGEVLVLQQEERGQEVGGGD